MSRRFFIAGSIYGLIGIILGAFAAHGLKPLLTLEAMNSFETGVRFQMYHAFLLLILGNYENQHHKVLNSVFYLLLLGVLLFSGSIYFLATNVLTAFDFTTIAIITPIGGSLLIFCWILLLIHFIKLKKE